MLFFSELLINGRRRRVRHSRIPTDISRLHTVFPTVRWWTITEIVAAADVWQTTFLSETMSADDVALITSFLVRSRVTCFYRCWRWWFTSIWGWNSSSSSWWGSWFNSRNFGVRRQLSARYVVQCLQCSFVLLLIEWLSYLFICCQIFSLCSFACTCFANGSNAL